MTGTHKPSLLALEDATFARERCIFLKYRSTPSTLSSACGHRRGGGTTPVRARPVAGSRDLVPVEGAFTWIATHATGGDAVFRVGWASPPVGGGHAGLREQRLARLGAGPTTSGGGRLAGATGRAARHSSGIRIWRPRWIRTPTKAVTGSVSSPATMRGCVEVSRSMSDQAEIRDRSRATRLAAHRASGTI